MTAKVDSKPYGVVYCIENTVNGKRYVGQTVQPIQKRWMSHQAHNECAALHGSIKKYGAQAFEIYILDEADSKSNLDTLEDFYIRLLNTVDRSIGYNLRGGGSFGTHSDDSKKKMSGKVLAAYARGDLLEKRRLQKTGSKLTDLQKQALREANIGKKASDETRKKLSAVRKALWASESGEKMRKASIEARRSNEFRARASEITKAHFAAKKAAQI